MDKHKNNKPKNEKHNNADIIDDNLQTSDHDSSDETTRENTDTTGSTIDPNLDIGRNEEHVSDPENGETNPLDDLNSSDGDDYYESEENDTDVNQPEYRDTERTATSETSKLKKEMVLGVSLLLIILIVALSVVLVFNRNGSGDKVNIVKTKLGTVTQADLYQYYRLNNSNDVIVELVINKILLEEFPPSEKELTKLFNEKKQPYQNDSDFEDYIISLGFLDVAAYKEDLAVKISHENFTNSLTPTEEEIVAYYNDNVTENRHVSHILLDNEDTAKEVKERLNAGESFEELALEYSTDTESKENGGQIGETDDISNLPSQMNEAIKAMGENEISDLVHTEFGFHIIKVTQIDPKKELDEIRSELEQLIIRENSGTELVALLRRSQPITYKDKFFDQKIESLLEQFE